MQPLQRSYAITAGRIENLLIAGTLSGIYDEGKVTELENAEELTGKEQKKLEDYQSNKPFFEALMRRLDDAVSEQIWLEPVSFIEHLTQVFSNITTDKKLIEKIADGLSVMDKTAVVQTDRKGNIIYDKNTKDIELVKFEEDINDYMTREVLPYIPDAKAFFEEDLSKKKPIIKTGAEIPFTRYFYKFQKPIASEELGVRFSELEIIVSKRIAKLFE